MSSGTNTYYTGTYDTGRKSMTLKLCSCMTLALFLYVVCKLIVVHDELGLHVVTGAGMNAFTPIYGSL